MKIEDFRVLNIAIEADKRMILSGLTYAERDQIFQYMNAALQKRLLNNSGELSAYDISAIDAVSRFLENMKSEDGAVNLWYPEFALPKHW